MLRSSRASRARRTTDPHDDRGSPQSLGKGGPRRRRAARGAERQSRAHRVGPHPAPIPPQPPCRHLAPCGARGRSASTPSTRPAYELCGVGREPSSIQACEGSRQTAQTPNHWRANWATTRGMELRSRAPRSSRSAPGPMRRWCQRPRGLARCRSGPRSSRHWLGRTSRRGTRARRSPRGTPGRKRPVELRGQCVRVAGRARAR